MQAKLDGPSALLIYRSLSYVGLHAISYLSERASLFSCGFGRVVAMALEITQRMTACFSRYF